MQTIKELSAGFRAEINDRLEQRGEEPVRLYEAIGLFEQAVARAVDQVVMLRDGDPQINAVAWNRRLRPRIVERRAS